MEKEKESECFQSAVGMGKKTQSGNQRRTTIVLTQDKIHDLGK